MISVKCMINGSTMSAVIVTIKRIVALKKYMVASGVVTAVYTNFLPVIVALYVTIIRIVVSYDRAGTTGVCYDHFVCFDHDIVFNEDITGIATYIYSISSSAVNLPGSIMNNRISYFYFMSTMNIDTMSKPCVTFYVFCP